MNRIRRISMEILENHKEKFGTDFAKNKKILDQVSIVRSKGLKNELAGYITTYIKREIEEQKEKEARNLQDVESSETEITEEILN